jgi:dTDP-4-amino-4,6-dideoxygalactose transaminase
MSTETPFIPFALPDLGEAEISEVVDSLKSGWITSGPKVLQFEKAFASFIGDGIEAAALSSATAGLHLALQAVGVGPEDEVITTVFTFTATAAAIRYLGADPVFVDVDPVTLNIDPDRVADAITSRTKAIVPVHYAGLACDMARLIELARSRDLRIVEDAAHALPTTYRKRQIGTLDTDAAVFSFYANKPLATGEGGMVVSRYGELIRRVQIMRCHGIDRNVFQRYQSARANWAYEVVAPGYKYNLTDIAASIGIHQLRRLRHLHFQRQAIAFRYFQSLLDSPVSLPACPPEGDLHAWHLFVIRLRDEAPVNRDQFIERMQEAGIGCSVHYIPLHFHPYWRDRYRLRPEHFPVATDVYRRCVSLPLYTKMTDQMVDRVCQAFKQVLLAEQIS